MLKKYIILFTPFIRDQSENSKYLPFTLFVEKENNKIHVLLIDNRHIALRTIE